MSKTATVWKYAESFQDDRVQRLLSVTDFTEVIGYLSKALIVGCAWEPFQAPRLKGCNRASFLLRVDPERYDEFFNAPTGYRAQYAKSTKAGELANRQLLNALEPRLLIYASQSANISEELTLKSLRATDAKLWIRESEVESHLGHDEPEILYLPWQTTPTDGVGLRAPIGTEIEIKGGWLDIRGQEQLDPFKATRSHDIHSVGFS